MSTGTGIEWCDATWNPVVGCTRVSRGCEHCYAERMAWRLERMGQAKYAGLTETRQGRPGWTARVTFDGMALKEPLRWRKGRAIFVCSMGDLFHERVPDEWIDRVLAVAALTPQHRYIVLTKRPERMRAYLMEGHADTSCVTWSIRIHDEMCRLKGVERMDVPGAPFIAPPALPLPNVWLGTSVEDQATADEHVPPLLELAAQGWPVGVSYEPALGPVDWEPWLHCISCDRETSGQCDCPDGEAHRGLARLSWLIMGGESGPDARPMHPDWVRSARDQCKAAGVPLYFKQWGEWGPMQTTKAGRHYPAAYWDSEGERCDEDSGAPGAHVFRVGKAAAGRLVDGETHDDLPWRADHG